MIRKFRISLSYHKHSYMRKMKALTNIVFKPSRVYKALLIFVLAVTLYVIVYHEEFSSNRPIAVTVHQELLRVENRIKTVNVKQHTENREFSVKTDEKQSMKYILLWTPTITPFHLIRKRGQVPFISNGCEHTNCFLTHRRHYFPDITKFDAIVFSIAALKDLYKLPKDRSLKQKFVAASIEPPQKYPVINPLYDGYFNWTWTYRLNSDIPLRYLRIFNAHKKEVGPKKDMKWVTKFAPLGDKLDTLLTYKKKAVAWIKTCCNCLDLNNYEQAKYILYLEKELDHYGLSLDTYSNCSGYKSCGSITECTTMVLEGYYFYLAFEEYFDDDYVTEVLLYALLNYAVPVVMGNANYSRFLPPGSYLDAKQLSAKALAKIIDDSMEDFNTFQQYFKWRSYYYYERTGVESEICNICTALNNKQMVKNVTVYNNFRKMWNGETSVLITDFLFQVFENDETLRQMVQYGNYSAIRKAFKKRHLPNPRDSVYVFDMSRLNLTTTEGTFIPYELTSDTMIEL